MPANCPACDTKTEEWWSYCAMCGYHIAAGNDHDREITRLRNEVADLRSYAKACREWMENSPIRSVKG